MTFIIRCGLAIAFTAAACRIAWAHANGVSLDRLTALIAVSVLGAGVIVLFKELAHA